MSGPPAPGFGHVVVDRVIDPVVVDKISTPIDVNIAQSIPLQININDVVLPPNIALGSVVSLVVPGMPGPALGVTIQKIEGEWLQVQQNVQVPNGPIPVWFWIHARAGIWG